MQALSSLMESLYGRGADTSAHLERFKKLKRRFEEQYAAVPSAYFSSPGRVEICGNHTDHNHGKVLVGAISVDTIAAVSPHPNEVVVLSEGYPEVRFPAGDTALRSEEYGTSYALVKGVMQAFKDRGYNVGGFVAVTSSNVFKGAGVSSSASFELLVTEILNKLYNGGAVQAVERAVISQYAENVYFNKPSGLLDQMGIALGGISTIDFADPKEPLVKSLYLSLNGLCIYIVNTGGDHSNLTPAYAGIKSDMQLVAAYFGKQYLRDVSENEFYSSLPGLSAAVSGRAVLRAVHFFEENKRVERAARAVEREDAPALLAEINASGDSSWKLLQNCYVEGDVSQRIPLGLAAAARYTEGGAVRVHGGGFAGTVLCFVPEKNAAAFEEGMSEIFGAENIFGISVREKGACSVDIDI